MYQFLISPVEFRRSTRNFWRVKTTHERFFLRVKTGHFRIFMHQNPGLRVKREPCQRTKILKFSFFVPMFQIVTPVAGPVLTPRASYEQPWQRSTRRCYKPNIQALAFTVLDKKKFKNLVNHNIGLISTPGP